MIPNIKFVFKFNSNPWKNPKDHYSIGPCPPSMRPTRLPALFSRAAPRLTALSRRSHPSVTNLTRSHLPVSPPSFPSSSSSVATFSLSRQLPGKGEASRPLVTRAIAHRGINFPGITAENAAHHFAARSPVGRQPSAGYLSPACHGIQVSTCMIPQGRTPRRPVALPNTTAHRRHRRRPHHPSRVREKNLAAALLATPPSPIVAIRCPAVINGGAPWSNQAAAFSLSSTAILASTRSNSPPSAFNPLIRRRL